MATKTEIDIVGYLLHQEELSTIRGIARNLKKSYPLVYHTVEKLRKQNIIIKKEAPPAHILTLNPHSRSQIFLDAEQARKEKFLAKYPWLNIFVKDILAHSKTSFCVLALFGSYAKETSTKSSDLDILAITPHQKDCQILEDALGASYTKVRKHIVVVPEQDFVDMIKQSSQFNVGNEVRKHHVLLYGSEQYYQLVWGIP